MAELSKAEKLLIAAGRLVREGRTKFSAEDLVVSAFREFPSDFSLKGHAEYPDSNSVLTQLMGKDARLIVKGWLEKTGTKQYRLTPKGLHDLAALDDSSEGEIRIHLDRETEEELGRLLTSPAYELYEAGDKEKITFHQFCRFVGLAAGDKWQRVQGKLTSTRHLVDSARRLGEAGQTVKIHFRGRNDNYPPEHLMRLKAVLDFLLARFEREMREWERKELQ
jgi:DNA-binding PadR family transcriptional regulator